MEPANSDKLKLSNALFSAAGLSAFSLSGVVALENYAIESSLVRENEKPSPVNSYSIANCAEYALGGFSLGLLTSGIMAKGAERRGKK